MSLRLWGTISGWGKSAGTMIPALGSGRYAPGPNIVWPSWLNGSDPNYTINACWRQPGLPATVSKKPEKFWLPHGMPSDDREFAFSSRVFPKASQIKALYKLWHYQLRAFPQVGQLGMQGASKSACSAN